MNRARQILLIVSTLGLTWLGMMVVHEWGHVVGAWLSGGAVSEVVLHPLAFSQTVLSHNPHPLFVVVCGPVLGILFPLAVLGGAALVKAPGVYLIRFFAGFCLIANGAYLGIGVFDHIGDAGDLIALGASPWMLWMFGAITCPIGFFLRHGLGPRFGLGATRGRVGAIPTLVVTTLLLLVIVIELIFSPV